MRTSRPLTNKVTAIHLSPSADRLTTHGAYAHNDRGRSEWMKHPCGRGGFPSESRPPRVKKFLGTLLPWFRILRAAAVVCEQLNH